MAVDTEIPGSPASIREAATWLRDNLSPNLVTASDEFNRAGLDAQQVWDSEAGADFREAVTRADVAAQDLEKAARELADNLDSLAFSLETCQSDMGTVRADAAAAGLTVSGFLIEDPGTLWDRPRPPTTDDPNVVAEYDQADADWIAQRNKIDAYLHADSEADRIGRVYQAAAEDFSGRYSAADHASWMISSGYIATEGLAAGAAAYYAGRVSKFGKLADDLASQAAAKAAAMAANPAKYRMFRGGGWNPLNWFAKTRESSLLQRLLPNVKNTALWNADQQVVDDLLRESAQARNVADDAAKAALPGRLKVAGKVLGAAGLGLGIWSDLNSGETVPEAVVSQGVGFAASVATGAAIGTLIPVPVVGTVVGALVGAGVAIFADGAIDSLFENGPDVGKALESGWDAMKDVGSAIGSFFGIGD